MDYYPYYEVRDRALAQPGVPAAPCQACTSCAQSMAKAVHLFGQAYHPDTLEPRGASNVDPRVSYHVRGAVETRSHRMQSTSPKAQCECARWHKSSLREFNNQLHCKIAFFRNGANKSN